MRSLGRIAAFALLPLLAGCFDYREGFAFRSDGTVVVTVETVMSAAMFAMALQGNADTFCPAIVEDVPQGFTAVAERATEEDGDAVCRITATGPIALLPDALASAGLRPPGLDEESATITLKDLGGGVYSFDLVYTVPPEDTAPPATPEAAAAAAQMQAMEAMIIEAMAGRLLTWSVTARRIIETDGTLVGNTATFELPLTITMTDPGTEHTFHVRFAI